MYKQYKDKMTGQVAEQAIIRLSDNACIPFDPDNTDYQAYLQWLAEGNEPLPPDSQE
jgi:hypothetical protein